MKKIIFTLLLLFIGVATQTLSAQSVDNLFKKIAAMPDVVTQGVDKSMMSEKDFAELQEIAINGHVDSIRVYDMSACDLDSKKEYKSDMDAVKDTDTCVTLLNITEGGTNVKMLSDRNSAGLIERIYVLIYVSDDAEGGDEPNVAAIAVIMHGKMENVNTEKVNVGG